MRTFKAGPDRVFHRAGLDGYYIAIQNSHIRVQYGQDLLVSSQCANLEELKAEVERLKLELDQALEDATFLYDY
jgi:hypothetical protein